MDYTTEGQPSELLEMHLDYDGGNTLHETVRWSKFLSIVGIAGAGILLLLVLVGGPFLLLGYSQVTSEGEGLVGAVLAVLAIYFAALIFASIVLLRFSRMTRKGLEHQDQPTFNRGLKSLRVYLLVMGILSCLSLAAILLGLIFQR